MLSLLPPGFQQSLSAGRWDKGSRLRLCWRMASNSPRMCALACWGHLEMIGAVTWDWSMEPYQRLVTAEGHILLTLVIFGREEWLNCWCPKHNVNLPPMLTDIIWWPKRLSNSCIKGLLYVVGCHDWLPWCSLTDYCLCAQCLLSNHFQWLGS